jgi:hypothetical protein
VPAITAWSTITLLTAFMAQTWETVPDEWETALSGKRIRGAPIALPRIQHWQLGEQTITPAERIGSSGGVIWGSVAKLSTWIGAPS